MIEVYFSKINNSYEIKTDKPLLVQWRPYLKSNGFIDVGNNMWKKNILDDDTVQIIYDLFGRYNQYKIIPNDEVKKIYEQNLARKKEYETFIDIGIKIKKNKNPSLPKIELKDGISLKDFQKMPINHMITVPHTANFSIPGSGKTLMTLSAFNILKRENKVDQMWVIGPLASFRAWEDEYEFLFGKSKIKHTIRYHGNRNERKSLRNKIKNKDIVITSYDTAVHDFDLIKLLWKVNNTKILLVLDESHHIKSIDEFTSLGNNTNSSKIIELGKFAERRCILTGTPIPRNLADLWSQMTFLWPHMEPFKTRKEFLAQIKNEFDIEDSVKDIIEFMWTRVTNKELASEMPERYEKIIPVKMDLIQQKIYRIIESQILHEMVEGAEQEKVRKLKKAKIIRLLQTVTNPKLIGENDPDFNIEKLTIKNDDDKSILNLISEYSDTPPKILSVAKLARDLTSQKTPKNVLIFTVFKGTARDLKNELKDQNPLLVTGDYDAKERENIYEEFKDWTFPNNKGRILIATIGSIAESVSLHKNKAGKPVCQNVIYLERNHNGGQYMQSLYRVYRVGSEKKLPINYYFFESIFENEGTSIDNRVSRILEHRTETMFDILGDEFELKPMSLGIDDTDKGFDNDERFNDDSDDEVDDELFEQITSDAKKHLMK